MRLTYALQCYVCLPSVHETNIAQALEIRANISRSWDSRNESSFRECKDFNSLDASFILNCEDLKSPASVRAQVEQCCMEVTDGRWYARTCSTMNVTEMKLRQEYTYRGLKYIKCIGETCNGTATFRANGLTIFLLSVIVALAIKVSNL
ncbi:hypothetical protein Avbf_14775 [Armadillidium vulgare]|nr:hypothetical protein Avbf_14775 [Armadillidium vulgare]